MRVVHAPGMPGTFSPPPRVGDSDMHHGTCVTHVPWCMPASLTSCFLWSRWRGKRSRHSRRMRNPQFYVSGKRPMSVYLHARVYTNWEATLGWITPISNISNKRVMAPMASVRHDDVIKWKHFRVTGHLCGDSPVRGEFPAQRPVTRSFDSFFDLRLNKRLS